MPTYQYVCTECATPLEVVQTFTEPALTECPTCGGRLRKVFSALASPDFEALAATFSRLSLR